MALRAAERGLTAIDHLLKSEPQLQTDTSDSPLSDQPVIDSDLFEVRWKNHRCVLGPTLPFYLLLHLVRNPGRYITYRELQARVWNTAPRSREAVRSVVADLRARLRTASMPELADAIDGHMTMRYGWVLESERL